MKKFWIAPLIIILCISYTLVEAQSDSTRLEKRSSKDCEPKAIGDLFRKKGKPEKTPRKTSVLVLPNISSNPTNGFILGVGGGLGWYMGPKENTRVSTANFTAAVTSKQQLITFVKPNIFTKGNKYFFQGDFRYYIYSQPTYGLGTNSPDTINLDADFSFMGEGLGKDSVLFPM